MVPKTSEQPARNWAHITWHHALDAANVQRVHVGVQKGDFEYTSPPVILTQTLDKASEFCTIFPPPRQVAETPEDLQKRQMSKEKR